MLDIERPWWHPPLPEYPGAAVLALPRDDYQSPQRVSVEPGMVRLHFGRLTLPVERPTVVWSTGPDLRVEGRETSRVLRTGLPESELARVANVLDRVRDLQPGQRPFFRVVPSFDALATIDPDALFDPELVAPWGEASVDALHLLLPATDGRHYLRLRHQDVGWRLGGRLVHFPVHKVVAVRQRGFRLDIQLEGGAGVSWHLALPPARVYRLVHAIRAFLARNRAGGIDSPPHHLLQLRRP
ncbi:MAG: hypothetical protein H6736_12950 [Alphaproteobacteria bacterium]|nr:hypothetical protein [Alphaproteobacteria bacterium]MCB9692711.1 hypothetical protein [Alphaproteobacteria bacterium]